MDQLCFLTGSTNNTDDCIVGKFGGAANPTQTTAFTMSLQHGREFVQDSHGDGSKDYQRIHKRFDGKQGRDSVDDHWASCHAYGL